VKRRRSQLPEEGRLRGAGRPLEGGKQLGGRAQEEGAAGGTEEEDVVKALEEARRRLVRLVAAWGGLRGGSGSGSGAVGSGAERSTARPSPPRALRPIASTIRLAWNESRPEVGSSAKSGARPSTARSAQPIASRFRSPPEMPRTFPPPTADEATSARPMAASTSATLVDCAARSAAANRSVSAMVRRLKKASSW